MAKQTQAEIKKQEKDNFLSSTRTRFDDLVITYFLGQGIFLLPNDLLNYSNLIKPLQPHVSEFMEARRLIDDGASLTEKRKVQMLEAIYGLESHMAGIKINHPILGFYRDLTNKQGWAYLLVGVGLFVFLFGLAWYPFFFAAFPFLGIAVYFLILAKDLKGKISHHANQLISKI